MLNEKQAYAEFKKQIRVTPQMVLFAKKFILANGNFGSSTLISSSRMIDALLKAAGVTMPDVIILHASADTEDTIKKWADGVSWTLAGCEALWGLISDNLLIPWAFQAMNAVRYPAWATGHGGSGGRSGAWPEHIEFYVPANVVIPYSKREGASQSLDDPDLFLHDLAIEGLHSDVEEALREAVRCFHHELYLACLTMLGRASEGAWIELAVKLTEGESSKRAEKLRKQVESTWDGVATKIAKIVKFYGDENFCAPIYGESGIKAQDLVNSMVWADAVRESRNSIHYGVKPAMPNTYEKVAALLIGAVPHFRVLYKIISAVDRVRNGEQEGLE